MTGQQQRRRDRRRPSTESYDEFTTHHRYDSDSSLDLAKQTHYNSMALPSKIFKRRASQVLETSLQSTDPHAAGPQNHENRQLLTNGGSRLNEGYTRSNGGEMTEGEGQTMSRDMEATNELAAEADTVLVEGHSRSNGTWCVNCGCHYDTVSTNHITAGLSQTQGSAATHQSRCGGPSGVDDKQGRVGTCEPRRGGEHVTRGSVAARESRYGGHDWSRVFDLESYNGVVSHELCQQIVQLLTELDMARDVNIEVMIAVD